jgi:hypothetical protein
VSFASRAVRGMMIGMMISCASIKTAAGSSVDK